MTTIRWTRRKERNKKTGRLRVVYDASIWAGGRYIVGTRQGYTRLKTLQRVLARVADDMAKGNVRHNYKRLFARMTALFLVALLPAAALAVNSPRPASYRVENGAFVVTWTNLSEAHPWLLSYRTNIATPWLWDTTRLHAVSRSLTVAVPMDEQQGYFRLWPAAPEQ